MLESLVIRNLKLSTNGPTFDNCKCIHNIHAMFNFISSISKTYCHSCIPVSWDGAVEYTGGA